MWGAALRWTGSAPVPDLRQLRTFVAVAEELNFTRAAERLHLAQQAVSKSVRQLEDELGVPLLERTTRDVRLTAAGAALLESGRDALAAADAAFTRARDVGRGLAGTVRVGLTPAVGPAVHEELVHVLRDGAPELGVSAVEVRPRDVVRLLREREVDLVLARVGVDEPEIDSASLRPTPAVLGRARRPPAGRRRIRDDGRLGRRADADLEQPGHAVHRHAARARARGGRARRARRRARDR